MAFNARAQLANIPVVAHETARMVQAFRSWPQSYWSRPAYCPGWTAADAVAHLATGGDFYARCLLWAAAVSPNLPGAPVARKNSVRCGRRRCKNF